MSSSDRIIRARLRRTDQGRTTELAARPDPARTQGPARTAAVIIRGRRGNPTGPRSAADVRAAEGGSAAPVDRARPRLRGLPVAPGAPDSPGVASPAPHGAPGGDRSGSPALQVELRDLHRRAEDRGYAAGRARAEQELRAAIEAAGAMATRIEALAPRESMTVAHVIAELAMAIARRVVAGELRHDPSIVVRALEAAAASINGSPEARVLLHPETLDPVRTAWEAAHGSAHLGKRWTFEPDPTLPPGGCVLRYEHGVVVAGLEAQLDEIGNAIEAAIPGLWQERPVGPS